MTSNIFIAVLNISHSFIHFWGSDKNSLNVNFVSLPSSFLMDPHNDSNLLINAINSSGLLASPWFIFKIYPKVFNSEAPLANVLIE